MSVYLDTLEWRPDGDLTRLIADLPEEDENLVIDFDDARRGDKWFLTWFGPDNHDGIVLTAGPTPEALKHYAATWLGEDE